MARTEKKAKTVGALRESGYQVIPIKEEMRRNLIRRIQDKQAVLPGIFGYEESVFPQLENAILSGQDIIFLGERGQAKSRLIRSLMSLLDDEMPIIAGCEINDNPFAPICKRCRDLVDEDIELPKAESVVLAFSADVDFTINEGRYCDEASVMPGGMKTSSGKTAFVMIGSPAQELCEGEAVIVSKTVDTPIVTANTPTTYTYTIPLENIGTDTLRIDKIQDKLPKGFSYVSGSTSGDFFQNEDPAISTSQGRELLDWNFQPMNDLLPGETKARQFQAYADVASGDYWNEGWIQIIEFPDSIYTWPTAKVEVMGVFEIHATDGKRSVFAEVWLGSSSHVISKLNVN